MGASLSAGSPYMHRYEDSGLTALNIAEAEGCREAAEFFRGAEERAIG